MMSEEWGSRVELERMIRIKLSVAAHMYERHNCSFLSDVDFDEMSKLVDLDVKTGNRKLDNFFKKHFHPDTGMWVHKHPDRRGLERLCQTYYMDQVI